MQVRCAVLGLVLLSTWPACAAAPVRCCPECDQWLHMEQHALLDLSRPWRAEKRRTAVSLHTPFTSACTAGSQPALASIKVL